MKEFWRASVPMTVARSLLALAQQYIFKTIKINWFLLEPFNILTWGWELARRVTKELKPNNKLSTEN